MASHKNTGRRVLAIIVLHPGCDVEEIVVECPDLTWNQVFLELDRLSRMGYVILKQTGRGRYSVTPGTGTKHATVIH